MGFEKKFGISKKSFSILMAAMVLGIVTITAVAFTLNFAPYAYVGSLPNPGHGGDTVWVDVPASGEMTLQDALTTGVLGGGASLPDCPADGQILKYDLGTTSWTCVDETGGAGGSLVFGDWVNLTGSFSWGTAYGPVTSDGFITLWADGYHGGGGAQGYTDSSSNPTTLITGEGAGYVDYSHGLMMPVKKGDYWKISRTHAGYGNSGVGVRWMPLIDGGGAGGTSLPNCPVDGQILKYDLPSTSWLCVDEAAGAGGSLAFGNWADVTASASSGAVQGPAATDGFVVIGTDDWGKINAFTDSDNPPTRRLVYNVRDSVNEKQFTMPVKKGDYWRTSGTSIDSVHWIPLIDGGGGGGSESAFGNYEGTITVNSAVPSGSWTNEFVPVQAPTDLLLVATVAQTSDSWMVVSWRGYTGTTSNPTDYRAGMHITDDWGPPYTGSDSFTMFVKKGDYYVVKGRAHIDWATSTRTYSTIPIGS